MVGRKVRDAVELPVRHQIRVWWAMLLSLLSCTHPVPPAPAPEPVVVEPPAPDLVPELVPDLVPVAVPREFRGLWVATVSNLDFPSRTGLTADEGRAELAAIAEGARARGFNALVFQVRPESDALYASAIEPWSRFLTGRQGGDPGFDPLATLVEQAHARGLEVHAWFNPYRAAVARGVDAADNHVTRECSDAVCPWGNVVWMDPGSEVVRARTLDVITDVVTRYDVDGVHLDDYFYPYPDGAKRFPDARSYAAYTESGGTLGLSDWRRHNVDALVEAIEGRVRSVRPDCRFGISPFGVYRPGQPAGVRGMDQVAALHADPLAWYRAGWVDYLAPQLYWPTTKEGQAYGTLLGWWDAQVQPDRPLLVGLDVTKVGKDPAWTLDEVRAQVELSRQATHTAGQIWFRASPVLHDQAGIAALAAELYATPALPPPTPGYADEAAPPDVEAVAGGLVVSDDDRASARGYALYTGDDLHLDRVLPPSTERVDVPPGVWAVSAVRRGSVESAGVRVTVR